MTQGKGTVRGRGESVTSPVRVLGWRRRCNCGGGSGLVPVFCGCHVSVYGEIWSKKEDGSLKMPHYGTARDHQALYGTERGWREGRRREEGRRKDERLEGEYL